MVQKEKKITLKIIKAINPLNTYIEEFFKECELDILLFGADVLTIANNDKKKFIDVITMIFSAGINAHMNHPKDFTIEHKEIIPKKNNPDYTG